MIDTLMGADESVFKNPEVRIFEGLETGNYFVMTFIARLLRV